MGLYHKLRKILNDRGLEDDNVVTQFVIGLDERGLETIKIWNIKSLGPVPTAQEIDAADGDFIVQRNKIRNKLMDPFEHLLALYLARKGDTTLLDKLDAKLDRVFEENPKIRIKDLL